MSGRGNYPPGVHAGTPNAPWNEPEPPECGVCRESVVSPEDHAEGCENSDMDAEELEQAKRDWARDAAYEAHREKELGL